MRTSEMRTIKITVWLFADKVTKTLMGLLVFVLLARELEVYEFGLFNWSLAIVSLFSTVNALGHPSIIVRELLSQRNRTGEVLGTAVFIKFCVGFSSFIALVALSLAILPDEPTSRLLFILLGSTIIFKVGEVSIYWFEANLKVKHITVLQSLNIYVFAIIKILLLLNDWSLISVAICYSIEAFTLGFLLFFLLHRYGAGLDSLNISFNHAKEIIKASFPLMITAFAVLIYSRTDQIMIGWMIDKGAVGAYAISSKISEFWFFFPTAILISSFPSLLRLKEAADERYVDVFFKIYMVVAFYGIFIIIAAILFSEIIVSLFFGSEFKDAAPVIIALACGNVFAFLGMVSGRWLLLEGRQIINTYRTTLGVLLNIFLNFIFIPIFDILGAALATLATQIFTCFIFDLLMKETRPMFLLKIKAFNPFSLLLFILEVTRRS